MCPRALGEPLTTRLLLLYGDLPAVCYVLRVPEKGVAWRVLMIAIRRLVKSLTGTPRHKAAPDWYIDGDAPDWDTTKRPRFTYNTTTGAFEAA